MIKNACRFLFVALILLIGFDSEAFTLTSQIYPPDEPVTYFRIWVDNAAVPIEVSPITQPDGSSQLRYIFQVPPTTGTPIEVEACNPAGCSNPEAVPSQQFTPPARVIPSIE